MKWDKGRQNSGYLKFKVFSSKKLLMDCYILKFPTNSIIKPHKDKVEFGKHYRLNIVLTPFFKGGKFKIEKNIFKIPNFLYLFRPDKYIHSVSEITNGTRYVLSFGKILK